jgi:hypothetical protein
MSYHYTPPYLLLDAIQDRIHTDLIKCRPAKSVRSTIKINNDYENEFV